MLGVIGDAPNTPVWARYFDGQDWNAVYQRMQASDGQGILNAAVRELAVARQNAQNAGDSGAALIYEQRLRQVMSLSSQLYGQATSGDITSIARTASVADTLGGISSLSHLVVLGIVAILILQVAGPSLAAGFSNVMAKARR